MKKLLRKIDSKVVKLWMMVDVRGLADPPSHDHD